MAALNAVLISFMSWVAIQVAWHFFICRSHRGGHARADVMYSPYALAERVERERSQHANQQRDTGKHHIDPARSPHAVGLSAGELPLLSGHVRERITDAN
jgi:hypothetical protein